MIIIVYMKGESKMTYKEKLISKRMVDLKKLADEYSVKINEKGSKAVAADKVIKKIFETLRTEFTDEEIEKIKADLDNNVTLTAALEKARAASYEKPVKSEEIEKPEEPDNVDTPPELEKPATNEKPESRNSNGRAKPKKGAQLEFDGRSQNICAWAKELGISANTLYGRIYKMGWSVEKAFTTPIKSAKSNKA
jgi:hypothetical protein